MTLTLTPTDDFDAALEYARPGDTIILAPGRHTTRGNWAHKAWGYSLNGLTIHGEVSTTRPTLALVDPVMEVAGVTRPAGDTNIAWFGVDTDLDYIAFDCSLPEFPQYTTSGLRFHGRYSVTDCTITGLRGDKARQAEVFGISAQGDIGGSVIRRVKVSGCKPDSYVTAIYPGGTIAPTKPVLVEDCDVDLVGNHACYSATYDTTFLRCTGRGGEGWLYVDTGELRNCRVVNCDGSAAEAAFRLFSIEETRRELYAEICNIKAKRGLELWQTNDKPMRGSVVLNQCTLKGEYATSIVAPHCPVAIIDCAFTPGAICRHGPGQRPAFFSQAQSLGILFKITAA